MSFDEKEVEKLKEEKIVSIPLEQGNVFRPKLTEEQIQEISLNPFGTGQCLSTSAILKALRYLGVSIPLEQGNVFRLNNQRTT